MHPSVTGLDATAPFPPERVISHVRWRHVATVAPVWRNSAFPYFQKKRGEKSERTANPWDGYKENGMESAWEALTNRVRRKTHCKCDKKIPTVAICIANVGEVAMHLSYGQTTVLNAWTPETAVSVPGSVLVPVRPFCGTRPRSVYDAQWADRLVDCLGVTAVYDRLQGVPEQLLFIVQMIENNSDAGNLQGVLLHCQVLHDMASRLRADPLADEVMQICQHRILPTQGTLVSLKVRAHEVAERVIEHMKSIAGQSSHL